MIYQPWINDNAWEQNDPKLIQLAEQQIQLSHTVELKERISLYPQGIVFVRGPRQCALYSIQGLVVRIVNVRCIT